MAKETFFTFESKIDGLTIQAAIFEPGTEARGIVQLVHGMCEHKERYYPFMRFLASQGYICGIHDHRGHGGSVKSPDDLGYFYTGGYTGMIEDTHQMTSILKKQFGARHPFVLLGHSMGSLVVRCYVKKYDSEIDKLIVSGCPSINSAAGAGLAMVKTLKAVKGGRARSGMIDNLTGGSFEVPYKDEGRGAWVCSDKKIQEAYRADPLCSFTFTLSGYEALVTAQKETYNKKGWVLSNKDLPIRYFSGEGDPCAISPELLEKSVRFMRDLGYTNVTKKVYPNMRHEVLNEIGKEQVYQDMLAFIQE